MILITGGAYQGKRKAAEDIFGEGVWTDCSSCGFDEVYKCGRIYGYHRLIKRLMEAGISPDEFTERLCSENGGAIVVMDEIGCGIVPIDRDERRWREAVGRCGCMIAERSERVIRVVCGIPTDIK